jgi:dTDP-4-amino-4,6-dideoxygalactose transaminase
LPEPVVKKFKKRKDFLPFHLPEIREEDKKAVLEVLESGWLTTGPKAKEFEALFAKSCNAKEAIAVNSCTAAIHLCMAVLGISSGDEVILPSFTFPSTANEIIHLGATPVFVDSEPGTMNMDVSKLESLITPKTKAIIPTHFGGHPCPMDEILKLGRKYKVPVIEDAAHAQGSFYKGKPIGSLASFATCFSFYPTKNITTGEGGMIATQKSGEAKKLRILTLHGISKDAWKRYSKNGSWFFEIVVPGYKYNLTDIQAALGIAQLKKLKEMNEAKLKLAKLYDHYLQELPEIETPVTKPYATRNGHLYTIMVKKGPASRRNKLIESLRDWNIGTSVHFIPTHRHSWYRDHFHLSPKQFPVADEAFQRIISLPLYPKMTEEDVLYVAQAIRESLARI